VDKDLDQDQEDLLAKDLAKVQVDHLVKDLVGQEDLLDKVLVDLVAFQEEDLVPLE